MSGALLETPSKKAAAHFNSLDLKATPTKKSVSSAAKENVMPPREDDVSEVAKVTVTKDIAQASRTASRLATMSKEERFTGDIDCEECDEPLLRENTKRFVLFPIQYSEVCLVLK
jgi:ribonucleoside-diphosphate reductase subunit M2